MKRAFQVVDLGFGDSGKGTIVDYLCSHHRADLVVRFNGGPQAGHNVVLPDGRHHMFSQFGSGMFLPQVRTLLSHFMLIEPYAMLNEAAHLEKVGVDDALRRTFIDGRCKVITPPQQIANRIRERARGEMRHGTCGVGVGECVGDSQSHPELTIHAHDLADTSLVRRKLRHMLGLKSSSLGAACSFATADERSVFEDASWIDVAADVYRALAGQVTILSSEQASHIISNSTCSVFEGAQGVLLDENWGFNPYTTWSTTTFDNADTLLDAAEADIQRRRVGVLRTYMTRHGAGPFVTEDPRLDPLLPEPHNEDDGWPGRFRRGVLDFVMLRYALGVCGGVDTLAVTCLDRLPQLPDLACENYALGGPHSGSDLSFQKVRLDCSILSHCKPCYRHLATKSPEAFVSAIAHELGVEVGYTSTGPTRLDKREISGVEDFV